MDLLQAIVSGVLLGAVYALIAVGLTLLWGVMNVVNFAHGNLVMAAMYITFFAWSLLGLDPLAAIPIAILALAGMSVVMYYGTIRPLLNAGLLSQMLVTFGVLMVLQGGAQVLFSAEAKGVQEPFAAGFSINLGGVIAGGPQLVAAAGAALGLGGISWLLRRTEVGVALDAVAQDAQAAALMGVNVGRMNAIAWAITGATVGLAGALLMNFYTVDPFIGLNLGLIAFVVVSLGGFGSVGGAMLAGIAMGVIQTVVGRYVPAYDLAAVFALYLVVTFVRPQGLLGTR
jgi:branched-chain amino acid transport system permease protein